MRKLFVLVLVLACTAGCAESRGFDRGALRRQMRLATPEITDEDIEKVLAGKPQLKFPMRLAVYFAAPKDVYSYWDWWEVTWGEEDRSSLLSLKDDLKASGIVSDMVVISDTLVTRSESGVSLKDIRLAAARYHADTVLIVRGAAAIDKYSNFLTVFYLTIIGAWIAPGSHCDALFMVDGVLLDVRNEFLYLGAQAEAKDKVVRPVALLEGSVPLKNAKKKAFDLFKKELVQRLKNLKG